MEQFLEGLESDQNSGIDIMDQPLVPETTPPAANAVPPTQDLVPDENGAGDDDESGEFKPRNRRERRLLRKLSDEKNSSSFLATKVEALSNAIQQSNSADEPDYLKSLDSIYGTDTPETRAATELLKKAFKGISEDAKKSAIQEFQQIQQQEAEKANRAQEELDSFVDEIEDTYGIQLTTTQEKNFVELLKKMSPKDANKQIVGYADPHAVWEVFVERSKKTVPSTTAPRAKVLSNRSVTQGTPQTQSNLPDDVTLRFLRDSGIL